MTQPINRAGSAPTRKPNEIRKTAAGLATHPPFTAILDRGVDVPGGNPDLCMVRRSGVALRRSGREA
jgi:hypothetical protein